MCSPEKKATDNCMTKFGLLASGSLEIVLYLIKRNRLNLYLQLGAITQYDLIDWRFFDLPSDKFQIWPVINLSVGPNIN